MLASLGLLSVLAGAALVAAEDVMTALDLQTAGIYAPARDWTASSLGSCGVSEVSTNVPGANLTVNFTGTPDVLTLPDRILTLDTVFRAQDPREGPH